MRRKSNETIYYVNNLDEAITFYTEKLGFELEKHYDWGFALLKVDEEEGRVGLMSKTLHSRDFESADLPAPRLAINVAHLESELAAFAGQEVTVSTIAGEKDGNRAAHVYDSEGNAFFFWETGTGKLFSEES